MFIAIFKSAENTQALREKTRPQHDEYWNARLQKLKLAGPILADDGSTRLGQVLVIDATDQQEARAIIDNDPFVKVGLFTGYTLQRFRVSVENGKMP